MADISKITVGGVTGNIADTTARDAVSALATAQKALPAAQALINKLATSYQLTEDTVYSRYKTYYTRSGTEGAYVYTAMVLGTDYDATLEIPANTVYEQQGYQTSSLNTKLGELIDVLNALIPAHKQDAAS